MASADTFIDSGVVKSAVTARGLFDYRHMFDLHDSAMTVGPILDCPAGASPFGAQTRARGGAVTSVDPTYSEPVGRILDRVEGNLNRADGWLTAHSGAIDWSYLGSVDAHIRASEVAADLFAVDYTAHPEHYVAAALPHLPFADEAFALTLSANLLFIYPERLSVEEHVAALAELVRVTSGEVRVHPIVDATATRYPHLDHVRTVLARRGVYSALRPTTKAWLINGRHVLACWADR